MITNKIICGDALGALKALPDKSVHCCVTSPPYWGLRDYGVDGQIGLEKTPEEYVAKLVEIFREVRRVLRDDGALWLNLGDSYAANRSYQVSDGKHQAHDYGKSNAQSVPTGLKPKDLVGIPWRVAFALQADGSVDAKAVETIARVRSEILEAYRNEPIPDRVTEVLYQLAEEYRQAKGNSWWLRSDIIWAKPNPMPESVRDRPTKSHEHIFLLSKSARYYYDQDAIKESFSGQTGAAASFKRETKDHVIPKQSVAQHRLERTDREDSGKRNKRDVWWVATQPFPDAHYAVYPPELIRPCILAGTSARGCCPECGAPWERVTEKSRTFESGSGRSGNMPVGKNGPGLQGGGETLDVRRGPVVHSKTTGWHPTCSCDAGEPIPCIVLDPFMGAGTTGLVAKQESRHYLGIELDPEWAEKAQERIQRECPMERLVIAA